MHLISPGDFSASFTPASTVTRAGAGQDTAQPSQTSGFAFVMRRELEIQRATARCLAEAKGSHAGEISRTLREQEGRLAANIALLEQRYEMTLRVASLRSTRERFASAGGRVTSRPNVACLRAVADQHVELSAEIKMLIVGGADGQRGELILKEVARSHEHMARALRALIKEEDKVRDRELPPVVAMPVATILRIRSIGRGPALL